MSGEICAVQATLFSGDVSRFPYFMCICARFRLYVFIVSNHSGLGPDCTAICCEKIAFACVCFCTFCFCLTDTQVQTKPFVEVQHLTRDRRTWKFWLHVFSTDITTFSSRFLNGQLRITTALQHTDKFFHARMTQNDMKFHQCFLHSFQIPLRMTDVFCHGSITLPSILSIGSCSSPSDP